MVLQAAADADLAPAGQRPMAARRARPGAARAERGRGRAGRRRAPGGGRRSPGRGAAQSPDPARPRCSGQDQRLRLERGRIRVDVERRPGRDVEVRTPLLSLGIKGTSIEVAVDRRAEQRPGARGSGQRDHSWRHVRHRTSVPGQGLRQLTASDAAATRLEYADLPAERRPRCSRCAGTCRRPAETAQARPYRGRSDRRWPRRLRSSTIRSMLRERSSAPYASRRDGGGPGAWLDHQTSLFTILLIAVGGLAILIIPGVGAGPEPPPAMAEVGRPAEADDGVA